ncbi:MAG: hypothetical protein GEU75_14580 [Dehalococcoidia bacterium]|nr:hypothetical protein [Dehalococcoidia bacterium]
MVDGRQFSDNAAPGASNDLVPRRSAVVECGRPAKPRERELPISSERGTPMLQQVIGKGKYGSDLIVDLMQRYGIEYVALNPGSTFRGLHDSLVNYGANKPEIILCQHEKIAVQIAHGYAKALGKPMGAIAHDTVGLLHATNGIYYAYMDRAPIILMGATGPMDASRRRPNIDWIHTTVLTSDPIREYVKWDSQPFGTADVIDTFARAYRVATQQPQGPVYLCYDAAFQEDPLEGEWVLPDPEKTTAGTAFHADPAALDQLADWLIGSRQPVLIAGYMARYKPSFYVLVELAEALGAAVIDQRSRFNFPTDHPLNISGAAGKTLSEADVVVGLDVKDLFGAVNRVDMSARTTSSILQPNCKITEIAMRDVGISKWSHEYQQIQPVDMEVMPTRRRRCRRSSNASRRRWPPTRRLRRAPRSAPRRPPRSTPTPAHAGPKTRKRTGTPSHSRRLAWAARLPRRSRATTTS